MSQVVKTVVILGAAAGLAVAAASLGPSEVQQDLYSDEGEEFFPAFTASDAAVELEVTEFNAEKATARKFAVSRDKDGRWIIPSHGGYPADAKDQMGKAAAMLIGLTKTRAVSDRKEDHVEFGVVDPLDPSSDSAGRGSRVVMRDNSGNPLADLIVGQEVDGKLDVYYVREPGKRRTYSTKLEGELSTRFADWIETDLLKAKAFDMQKVVFDNYSIDEQAGRIVPGEKLVVQKNAENQWTLDGLDEATEEPNADKMREIADALTSIKIVGVRSKPEGLTGALERATGFEQVMLQQTLQDKGYFLTRDGKLYSNEGDLIFETKKGVRYTLRFGELVPGDDDSVTSGKIGGSEKEGENGEAVLKNNRYLMVVAEFDEALLEKPERARVAEEHMDKRRTAREQIEKVVAAVDVYRNRNDGKLPPSITALTEKPAEGEAPLAELPKDPWGNDYLYEVEGEAFVVMSHGADGAAGGEVENADIRSDAWTFEDDMRRLADAWDAYDKKVEEGQEEAESLTKRFGPWYYVIDKALFDQLKPTRADLVQPKAAEEEGSDSGK